MFRKLDIRSTVTTALAAALVFCIPVLIFMMRRDYRDSWLLYLGSFFFLAVSYWHAVRDSQKRGNRESTVTLVFNSHMATILGVLISCLITTILLLIFVPGFLTGSSPANDLSREPGQLTNGETDGMVFQLYLAAAVINFSCGSFCGIIVPFNAKRNQKKDDNDPAPLHQRYSK